MSTTFWIIVKDEDWQDKEIEIWFRWNGFRWKNELWPYLPDDMKIEALDNTPQWIYTIWDFKKAFTK